MSSDDARFEALLDYLKGTRGFDFTAYKRSSLMRRIQKRLQAIGIESYDAYQAYLEAHPDEFGLLFNTILINVTGFFRDQATWEHLATAIIPQVLAARQPESPLRVWCAGCASGKPAATRNPGAELPQVPTRPLLCGMFLISQSIVSYVSLDSSTSLLLFLRSMCGVMNW